jgi:hypothetical protein
MEGDQFQENTSDPGATGNICKYLSKVSRNEK